MKKFLSKIAILLAVILVFSTVFSCGEDSTPSEYVIQYTDDLGVHSITVLPNTLYSIDEIPQKFGYEFLGLFENKTGGRQFVDENGQSLSAFKENSNIVLYPLFKAKEYTLVLDYQGAPVTGDRSMTVSYDSLITNLPLGLELEHKTFLGWFTKPSCDGVQVADRYGEIPKKNLVNETVFDLSGDTIYLYAGFETEKHTVVFNFGNGVASEEIQVAYGSDVKDILYQTRVGGNGVLTWSTEENDEDKSHVFTGKIIEDITLYAVEFAPVIEFNVNGGKQIAPIIATANTPISLPVPQKEDYLFVGWLDGNGNSINLTAMPNESATLFAKWQAIIVLDENGGSDVQDVSKPSEESIVLPAPQKDGFIFAGWYTQDREKYESNVMPSASVRLKAGWYRVQSKTIVLKTQDEKSAYLAWYFNLVEHEVNKSKGPTVNHYLLINLEGLIPSDGCIIDISLHYKMQASWTGYKGGFYLYQKDVLSENYFIEKTVEDVPMERWETYNYQSTIKLDSDRLYLYYYGKSSSTEPDGYSSSKLWFADIYVDVSYPDTSVLYL